MDKNQLQNFISLAHTLNFSLAAKQQFISQPALTKQISRLEAELGTKLFARSRHGVSLTISGTEFYRYATEILDAMNRAQQRISDIERGRIGFLKISTVPNCEALVARCVAAFNERYGDIQVSIHSNTGTQQIMAINKREFDVYFSYESLLTSVRMLETTSLDTDEYVVYLNRSALPKVQESGLTALNGMTHLMESHTAGPFLNSEIQELMAKLKLQSEVNGSFSSTSTILLAIQAGLGYAILPSRMNLGVLPEDITVVPILGLDTVIQNAIGWYSDTSNSSALNFVELVRELMDV